MNVTCAGRCLLALAGKAICTRAYPRECSGLRIGTLLAEGGGMRSILLALVLASCVAAPASDGRDDMFLAGGKTDSGISEGSPEAAGVLAVANGLGEDQLRDEVGLSANAASHIAATAPYSTLADLDAVPYVGSIAFNKLLAYARANGYIAGGSGPTPTRGKLLDCNTPVGPDQQVTVVSDGSSLKLVELTTSGAEQDRSLSPAEWASGTLQLREDFGSRATMTKESDGWVVHDSGSIGYADCWVDKSN